MASNFNNNTLLQDGADERVPAATAPAAATPASDPATAPAAPSASAEATPAAPAAAESPAFIRFRSCRWQQPAENGSQEYCTHREVKPYAGTQGFDPDAWCPDCQYYKLRRAPKKRGPNDDYNYY